MHWKDIHSAQGVGAVAIYLSLVFQPEFIHAFECVFRDGARAAQPTATVVDPE